MRRALARAADALDLVARAGAVLAFAVLIFAVLVQVLGRSVVGASPVWTEELTRFALLWLAAFGAGAALRSGDLVNVDLLSEALPRPLPWLLRLGAALAVAVLCALLIAPAWRFTAIGAMQTSPALGLRMTWVHASMLVLLGGLLAFAALRVAGMLAGAEDGRPVRPEEEGP